MNAVADIYVSGKRTFNEIDVLCLSIDKITDSLRIIHLTNERDDVKELVVEAINKLNSIADFLDASSNSDVDYDGVLYDLIYVVCTFNILKKMTANNWNSIYSIIYNSLYDIERSVRAIFS